MSMCVHNHKNNQVSICTTIKHVALLGACMFPTTKRFIVGQSLHAYWGPGAMSHVLPKREEKKNEHGGRIQHVSRIYMTCIWINLMLMLFSKCRSEMFSTICDFKPSSLLILLLFSAVHGRPDSISAISERPDLFGSSSRRPNLISADCRRPELIRTKIDLSRPWTTRFDLVLLKWLY